MLECSTGEVLARAAFIHHDNQEHDALRYHAVLKGLSNMAKGNDGKMDILGYDTRDIISFIYKNSRGVLLPCISILIYCVIKATRHVFSLLQT